MLHLIGQPAPDRADGIFADSWPEAALESVPLIEHRPGHPRVGGATGSIGAPRMSVASQGRAQQLDGPQSGAFNPEDIEIKCVGNRHVGRQI